MPFAEVIYEPGSKSVVQYDSLDELKAGLSEQHRKAKAGEVGGPGGHPAERITRVLLYSVHPADHNRDGVVHTEELNKLIEGMTGSDSSVDITQLVEALRDEASPIFPQDQGRHESMFKMEAEELPTDFLEDSNDE